MGLHGSGEKSSHNTGHNVLEKLKKRKISGTAKAGSSVTRRVSKGPGKGDLVQFKANSSSAELPGKLVPRRVIKDVKPFNTQKTLLRGKIKKKMS